MSTKAIAALMNVGTTRQGAVAVADQDALAELHYLGYIGKNNGLTRKGSIKFQILNEDLMDASFGSLSGKY